MQISGFSSNFQVYSENVKNTGEAGTAQGGVDTDGDFQSVLSEASDRAEIGGDKSAGLQNGNLRRLRLIHLNDIHGAALPEDGQCAGLARTAAVVKRERAETPGAALTLNAGDIAEGTMVSYLSKGSVVSRSLADMGFDAIEPGNHDFAWGREQMDTMLKETNAPVVCANIETADGGEFARPYIMRELNGVKVGIIGLSTDVTNFTTDDKTAGLIMRDPAEALAKYIPAVKEEGADVVIALSHLGFDEDKKIAAQFPELDVIVGGHSHTALPHGEKIGNTLIVQSGFKGQYVGEADLWVDISAKSVASAEASLIEVGTDVEPDPEVAAIVKTYADEAAAAGSKPMGQALERLTYSHKGCAKLDQIHADSLRAALKAPIGMVNGRNLRANIEPGEVTYEELFNALPHTEDDAVLMQVPGRLIMEALEKRVSGGKRMAPASPSGFSYTYDLSRPEGERITSITMDDGSKFDPDKVYDMATSVSMSDKPMFKDCPKKVMGSAQEIFMDYFNNGSPWRNDPDGRVREVSGKQQ